MSRFARFETLKYSKSGGRIGKFIFSDGNTLVTPAYFPVLDIITGPPGLCRNGGIFKYLKRWILIDRVLENKFETCFLTEALHFIEYDLNYETISKNWLNDKGHKVNLLYWYNKCFQSNHSCNECNTTSDCGRIKKWRSSEGGKQKPIIFIDSSGFRFLKAQLNRNEKKKFQKYLEFSGFKITPESIFNLQMMLGANIVASFDLPIAAHNLTQEDREVRQEISLKNAVNLLKFLASQEGDYLPFPYLAIHALGYEDGKTQVQKYLERIKSEGLSSIPFGIAIGSMVPFRNVQSNKLIFGTALGIIRGIEEWKSGYLAKIPMHIFGVTGDIVPPLLYAGIDTFDSSSYIKSALHLLYSYEDSDGGINLIDFSQKNRHAFLRYIETLNSNLIKFYENGKEIDDFYAQKKSLPCTCPFCRYLNDDITNALDILWEPAYSSKKERKNTFHGRMPIKSELYALFAMHNLLLELKLFEQMVTAIKHDDLMKQAQTLSYGNKQRELWRAIEDYEIKQKFLGQAIPFPSHIPLKLINNQKINIQREFQSSSPTPNRYSVPEDYYPPQEKEILFLIPCSREKPYRDSPSHKEAFKVFSEIVKDPVLLSRIIHKVTVSGNYGPVPEEHEDEEAILNYDYMLDYDDKKQRQEVIDRLIKFLKNYAFNYKHIIVFATNNVYRKVMKRAIDNLNRDKNIRFNNLNTIVLPRRYRSRQAINELSEYLYKIL